MAVVASQWLLAIDGILGMTEIEHQCLGQRSIASDELFRQRMADTIHVAGCRGMSEA